jgi:hypothetical protein
MGLPLLQIAQADPTGAPQPPGLVPQWERMQLQKQQYGA